MKRDDTVYLQPVLDSINRIEQYTHEIDPNGFSTNNLVQDAVIRCAAYQVEIDGKQYAQLVIDWVGESPMEDGWLGDPAGPGREGPVMVRRLWRGACTGTC
jgi:hypothetical protein